MSAQVVEGEGSGTVEDRLRQIDERISYVISIPAGFSIILARVTFRYEHQKDLLHSAQRAFELKPSLEVPYALYW